MWRERAQIHVPCIPVHLAELLGSIAIVGEEVYQSCLELVAVDGPLLEGIEVVWNEFVPLRLR